MRLLLALTSCLLLALGVASCKVKNSSNNNDNTNTEQNGGAEGGETPETPEEPEPETPGEGGGDDPETPGEGGGDDPETPGEGGGDNPEEPGEGGGDNPETPGEGDGDDPETPGEGGGDNPETPGEGGGDDPETPGEGGVDEPETPGEGGGDDPETPGEGGGDDPETPGEGGGDDPETPGEGGGDEPETPGEGGGDEPETPSEGGGDDLETPGEGGGDDTEPEPDPIKLNAPNQLTYAYGKISWYPIEGATCYEYKFSYYAEESFITTETEIDMGTNTFICVRAVGDGEEYITSDNWATYLKRTPDKLEVTGVVINSDGLVTWVKNQYAVKYVYKLYEDGEVFESDGSGVKRYITYDDKGNPIYDEAYIWIKAIGNGSSHEDSEWKEFQYLGSNGSGDSSFM